jgi:heme A synthase
MMSKSFLGKVLSLIAILLAVVFWILNIAEVEAFAWFNLSFAIGIIAGTLGIVTLGKAIANKTTSLKKLYSIFGVLLLAIAAIEIILNFIPMDDLSKYLWPGIIGIIAVALFIATLVSGGKAYDTADNEKVGYKNYFQRKAEQDKLDAKAAEEEKNQK